MFAIYATKEQKQMREQTTTVVNGGIRVKCSATEIHLYIRIFFFCFIAPDLVGICHQAVRGNTNETYQSDYIINHSPATAVIFCHENV